MQVAAPRDGTDDVTDLTRATPSPTQRLVALAVVPGLLAVLFIVTRPFADVQLPPLPAFVPLETSALFMIDLITAVLFFSHYAIVRSRPLLVIAAGYLYAALILIPYLLAFPGLFVQDRPLVGGLQSTAWLFILKHCGLAASMAGFALFAPTPGSPPPQGGRRAIAVSVAAVCAVVVALGLLCIAGDAYLPVVASDGRRFSANWLLYAGLPIASFYGVAVALLWRRRGTVLGLWLMTVASVHLAGVPLSFFGAPSRFSIGWYTVVIVNLVANSLVLVILLLEVSNIYRRLLQAVRAQQREREARLVTGDTVTAMIAHELKQPLTAMVLKARTGARRLGQAAPDLEGAAADMRRIAEEGRRAGEIIDSIRANFRRDLRPRMAVDLNRLIVETVGVLQPELRRQHVRVQMELEASPADVAGDPTQLQQVLLNLMTNSVEAAASGPRRKQLTLRSERTADSEVLVSVSDTGPGVRPEHLNRVFDPQFTTKPTGMGMGLAICRTIIQAHGGRIWVSANSPHGAVFQFALPPSET